MEDNPGNSDEVNQPTNDLPAPEMENDDEVEELENDESIMDYSDEPLDLSLETRVRANPDSGEFRPREVSGPSVSQVTTTMVYIEQNIVETVQVSQEMSTQTDSPNEYQLEQQIEEYIEPQQYMEQQIEEYIEPQQYMEQQTEEYIVPQQSMEQMEYMLPPQPQYILEQTLHPAPEYYMQHPSHYPQPTVDYGIPQPTQYVMQVPPQYAPQYPQPYPMQYPLQVPLQVPIPLVPQYIPQLPNFPLGQQLQQPLEYPPQLVMVPQPNEDYAILSPSVPQPIEDYGIPSSSVPQPNEDYAILSPSVPQPIEDYGIPSSSVPQEELQEISVENLPPVLEIEDQPSDQLQAALVVMEQAQELNAVPTDDFPVLPGPSSLPKKKGQGEKSGKRKKTKFVPLEVPINYSPYQPAEKRESSRGSRRGEMELFSGDLPIEDSSDIPEQQRDEMNTSCRVPPTQDSSGSSSSRRVEGSTIPATYRSSQAQDTPVQTPCSRFITPTQLIEISRNGFSRSTVHYQTRRGGLRRGYGIRRYYNSRIVWNSERFRGSRHRYVPGTYRGPYFRQPLHVPYKSPRKYFRYRRGTPFSRTPTVSALQTPRELFNILPERQQPRESNVASRENYITPQASSRRTGRPIIKTSTPRDSTSSPGNTLDVLSTVNRFAVLQDDESEDEEEQSTAPQPTEMITEDEIVETTTEEVIAEDSGMADSTEAVAPIEEEERILTWHEETFPEDVILTSSAHSIATALPRQREEDEQINTSFDLSKLEEALPHCVTSSQTEETCVPSTASSPSSKPKETKEEALSEDSIRKTSSPSGPDDAIAVSQPAIKKPEQKTAKKQNKQKKQDSSKKAKQKTGSSNLGKQSTASEVPPRRNKKNKAGISDSSSEEETFSKASIKKTSSSGAEDSTDVLATSKKGEEKTTKKPNKQKQDSAKTTKEKTASSKSEKQSTASSVPPRRNKKNKAGTYDTPLVTLPAVSQKVATDPDEFGFSDDESEFKKKSRRKRKTKKQTSDSDPNVNVNDPNVFRFGEKRPETTGMTKKTGKESTSKNRDLSPQPGPSGLCNKKGGAKTNLRGDLLPSFGNDAAVFLEMANILRKLGSDDNVPILPGTKRRKISKGESWINVTPKTASGKNTQDPSERQRTQSNVRIPPPATHSIGAPKLSKKKKKKIKPKDSSSVPALTTSASIDTTSIFSFDASSLKFKTTQDDKETESNYSIKDLEEKLAIIDSDDHDDSDDCDDRNAQVEAVKLLLEKSFNPDLNLSASVTAIESDESINPLDEIQDINSLIIKAQETMENLLGNIALSGVDSKMVFEQLTTIGDAIDSYHQQIQVVKAKVGMKPSEDVSSSNTIVASTQLTPREETGSGSQSPRFPTLPMRGAPCNMEPRVNLLHHLDRSFTPLLNGDITASFLKAWIYRKKCLYEHVTPLVVTSELDMVARYRNNRASIPADLVNPKYEDIFNEEHPLQLKLIIPYGRSHLDLIVVRNKKRYILSFVRMFNEIFYEFHSEKMDDFLIDPNPTFVNNLEGPFNYRFIILERSSNKMYLGVTKGITAIFLKLDVNPEFVICEKYSFSNSRAYREFASKAKILEFLDWKMSTN